MRQPRQGSSTARTTDREDTASLRVALLRLANALRAPAASHGLTPSRLSAMVVLSQNPRTRVGDLARLLRITPASTSRLVDVLAESGMVHRLVDPSDQRASLLELTRAGTRVLQDVRRVGLQQLSDRIDALPPERREALLAAVPAIEELADAMTQAAPSGLSRDS